jgi:hypothetical protein
MSDLEGLLQDEVALHFGDRSHRRIRRGMVRNRGRRRILGGSFGPRELAPPGTFPSIAITARQSKK